MPEPDEIDRRVKVVGTSADREFARGRMNPLDELVKGGAFALTAVIPGSFAGIGFGALIRPADENLYAIIGGVLFLCVAGLSYLVWTFRAHRG